MVIALDMHKIVGWALPTRTDFGGRCPPYGVVALDMHKGNFRCAKQEKSENIKWML